MNFILHRSDTRGHADHGWLVSRHSFSFADYYNPERMGFGLLRVLNDDIVEPARGFGTHPHRNMEIISIPLSGTLRHEDSMGHQQTISPGEVQIMSAGSGITHAEYNHSDHDPVNFLQLWIEPREQNITPRYAQQRFHPDTQKNRFLSLIAPRPSAESLLINQDAWISLASLENNATLSYSLQQQGNGLYCFLISGQVKLGSEVLHPRDGIGITGFSEITITAQNSATVLCIDVPMNH
ncbi:MAG: pirin family protein [Desulfuromonadales bacterium]|nr:pirin family protein [Desulfuromonadales bacterium]MBN2792552.1 pirin family protein [Desulfuromonadales bacterium]